MLPEYFLKYLPTTPLIIILLFGIFWNATAQNTDSKTNQEFRIMFYNLENLFDTYDDPITNDDEFTPDGSKSWSYYRYKKKLNDLAKVIIAVGEWNPPAVIGLCEIENFQVLLDLTTKTPLESVGYQIIHENSNDARGIDVALLYRPELITKIHHTTIKNKNSEWATRDILLAQLLVSQKDTINIFVNHWPSRYGGKEQTESKRIEIANLLRHHIDSLQTISLSTKILIMGDFNDEPTDKSVKEILLTSPVSKEIEAQQLYNLSYTDFRSGKGTLVFKEINNTWFLFDQIFVSGSLIDGNGLITKGKQCEIYNPSWILKDNKPFRTYQGPIWKGGFSDHLPIFLDLYKY